LYIMTSLSGLVVCGGQSSRMSTDKSLLEYYGMPHRYFLYQLLKKFCRDVFLSVNEKQSAEIPTTYQYIIDHKEYQEIGPMAALLSAQKAYPGKAWLVVGCDYPFINEESISTLIDDCEGLATCYLHVEDGIPEPLLTIYEAEIFDAMEKWFERKHYSLSKFLLEQKATTIQPQHADLLRNINTMQEYIEVRDKLSGKTFSL
jgi:molybdopterin-guanine dinucleotide biosynthesis protein A